MRSLNCRAEHNGGHVLQIRPIDQAILQELSLCRFLTIKQIRNRFFSHGSYTHVSTLVKSLAEEHYLACLRPQAANQPYVYGLGKRGVQHLRKLGSTTRYYPSEHTMPSSIHLAHLLITNDILIAASRLSENTRGVVVADRRHYLTTTQKNRRAVPDAWVHLVVNETHCSIWWEVDRGSEEQEYIKQKILSILDFARHDHLNEFGIPLLAIAFVTTKGEYRLANLVHWTEQVLIKAGYRDFADVFRFTAIAEDSDAVVDPRQLFFAPIWREPFGRGQVRLFGD